MGDFGCGDGGWTPVMKTDGRKVRHKYAAYSRQISGVTGYWLQVMVSRPVD